jgi:formylglycine-generating enzyme required for sulfatase activity
MTRTRISDLSVRGLGLSALLAGIALVAWAAFVGMRVRDEPSPCDAGWASAAGRCCAPGQGSRGGTCRGTPTICPPGTRLLTKGTPGCVAQVEKVAIAGGSVLLGPTDWDGAAIRPPKVVAVQSFLLDRVEVTEDRYAECSRAGMCPARASSPEPGLPVHGVGAGEAEQFCAFAGGRLPTGAEWIFAAAGAEARRYPWGPHGLVCRRAAYGRVNGPCARGARGPDLAGIRNDGRTPEGVLDLAGNVAEWTRDQDGHLALRGGSFASTAAASLKSWAEQPPLASPEAGFRCAYAAPGSTIGGEPRED